jgi:hypothetical protein
MRTRWAPDDCSESYTVTRSINPQRARSTRCCDGAAVHRGAHLSPGAPGFLDQTSRTLWAAAAAPNPLKSGLVVFGGGVTPITLRIAPEKIAIGQANHSLQSSDRSGK